MNTRDLKYFIYLAESLSFTKTAEAFYVSQPSISIALKRLEEHFESTLIQRSRSVHNIKLTESGEILYRASQEILQLLDRTQIEINNSQAESVTIGFLPTIGGYYLPKVLPELTEYTETLNFLEEESSDIMFEMLRNNQVSLAIIGHTQDAYDEKWLTHIPIESHKFGLYVSKDHPLAKKKELKVEELTELDVTTLGSGYIHNKIFVDWIDKNKLKIKNMRYAAEIQTISSMIESGLYSGFMSELLVRDHSNLVRIPVENAPEIKVSLIINDEMPVTTLQEKFNEDFAQIIRKAYPQDK